MKKIICIFILALALLNVNAFAQNSVSTNDCANDPFNESCGMNNSAVKTTTLVCNNGTTFPNVSSTKGASRAQALCAQHGGIAAYVQDGASVQLPQNTNNLGDVPMFGGAGSASSSNTSIAANASAESLDSIASSGFDSSPGEAPVEETFSCGTSCDCPNQFDVCDKGTCVDRKVGCKDGDLAKGDAVCQWLCQGGGWTCPKDGGSCSGGTSTSTTDGKTTTGSTTDSTETTTTSGSTTGGETCPCGANACYKGTVKCCPGNYPATGKAFGCCSRKFEESELCL